MRKIEQQMNKAIAERVDFTAGNTSVYYISAQESGNPHGGRSEIYLHGNLIAEYWHDAPAGERLVVDTRTLARWPTSTTKSRLRALGANVTTKNGITYLDGERVQ